MQKTEDKGKISAHDQSDLLGVKPFGNIGAGRTSEETKKIVGKLKKKKGASIRASGSSSQSGSDANIGNVSKSIGSFINR